MIFYKNRLQLLHQLRLEIIIIYYERELFKHVILVLSVRNSIPLPPPDIRKQTITVITCFKISYQLLNCVVIYRSRLRKRIHVNITRSRHSVETRRMLLDVGGRYIDRDLVMA